MQTAKRGPAVRAEDQRPVVGGGQYDVGIVRDQSLQGQPDLVHQIVHGPAQRAEDGGRDAVDDQPDVFLAHAGELVCGLGGVPQGSGVGGGDHKDAVGIGGGKVEAVAQTGGGVDQRKVKMLPRSLQQRSEILEPDRLGPVRERGGQQAEIRDIRMGGGLAERVAPLQHVHKRNRRGIPHAQGNIQVAQTDVGVDTQHGAAFRGQAGCQTGADRGFSGSALSGG